MIKKNLVITQRQLDILREEMLLTGMSSISEMLRRILDKWIEKRKGISYEK